MQRIKFDRGGLADAAGYLSVMSLSFDEDAVARKAAALPWLLNRNPAGHPTGSYLMLLSLGGQVVGGMIMLADMVWLDGHERPLLLPIGTHVHPDYRGRGLAMLRETYAAMPEGVMLGIPNDVAFKIHQRIGASISNSRRVRFRLYRAGSMLARKLPVARFPAPVIDAASRVFARAVDALSPALRPDERLEPLNRFGPEFDTFWLAARPNWRFLCTRSAERMQWRYREAPIGHYDVDILRRDGAIVGMIVSRVTARDGRLVGQVADILTIRPDVRDLALLLAAASRRFRRSGAEAGEYAFIGGPALDAAGRCAGFWFPREHRNVAAHGFGAEDKADVDRLIGDLHFLRGDHDEDY